MNAAFSRSLSDKVFGSNKGAVIAAAFDVTSSCAFGVGFCPGEHPATKTTRIIGKEMRFIAFSHAFMKLRFVAHRR
ncbi:MAG TPA: hypothetical protein VF509_07585 [Sphingobium sp.]